MTVTIDRLVVGDPAEAWVDAGFAVSDDGRCPLGSVDLELVGREGGKGILSWVLAGIHPGVTEVDGIVTRAVAGVDEPTGEPHPRVHPNGVTRIDHIVLLTPSRRRTVAALEAIGLEVRRVRDAGDTYGIPMTQTFFRLGDVILEMISPAEKEDALAAADDGGPCRFFGLALDVDDIDALPGRYGDRLGRIKDAVQPGRRITTLRHKDLGLSVALAFMTADPDAAAKV